VLLVFFIVSRLSAQTESRRVDFMKDIQPILSSRCYLCHGPGTQMAGLRLDFRESALKGGDSDKKRLFQEMPPTGDRLTPEQIGFLRRWIDQGAVWPDVTAAAQTESRIGTVVTEQDHQHWAIITLLALRTRRWVTPFPSLLKTIKSKD